MTGEDHEGLGWLIRNKYLPKTYAEGNGKYGTIYIDYKKHNKLFKIISL